MEADEKVFRHSPLKIALTSAGVVIVGSSAFLSANPYLYLIAGSLLILAAKYAMSSARISNQGITITGLLSPKSMAWSEVGHVSIKSPSVELHARHGGRVLSIDGELQGYMEILDILASKRPDLFDNEEADPASNFQFSNSFQSGITIVIFAVTLFLFLVLGEQEKFIVLAVGFPIGMYVVYSASGCWTDDYTLGLLTLTGMNPLEAASWTKTGPVFTQKPGAYGPGHNSQSQAIDLDGANGYVQLPANIARGSGFTFAGWVYWNGGGNWQRIFNFGNDTSHYLFLTPRSGSGTLRFVINNGSGEQIVERAVALTSGSWQHVAVTLNGTNAILYLNGAQVASSTSFTIAPSAFNPVRNYLGKSQFPADPLFNGQLDEV